MERKILFMLTVLALSFAFIACDKDDNDDSKAVTLSFSSNDIALDLGSSNADLLKYVTASDGSTVTVSGVNYDLAGEQTATFKAGDVTESKKVKIKADKLTGTYIVTVSSGGVAFISGDGCILYATNGSKYNQVNLATLMNSNDPKQFLPDLETLVFTFNAETSSIPTYTGRVLGITPEIATYTFTNIVYGKDNNGRYAIKSFDMTGEASGYSPFTLSVELTKTKD